MIRDKDTNFLYLADTLKKPRYSAFLERFTKILRAEQISFELLESTKDIWAVDYMPIQTAMNRFVKFRYNPSYLQSKTQLTKISNGDVIAQSLGFKLEFSNLLLDGGNVIRSSDTVILCDKVFRENKDFGETNIIEEIKNKLEVNKLIFVPWDNSDFIGHADGMVRFLDDHHVLINDYNHPTEKKDFTLAFRNSIRNAGLSFTEVPYNPYTNKHSLSAEGVYINYLEMQNHVFIPQFNRPEQDAMALNAFNVIFNNRKVIGIDCTEIAKDGGVLNCISWNILKA